jgi:hypothetical protein
MLTRYSAQRYLPQLPLTSIGSAADFGNRPAHRVPGVVNFWRGMAAAQLLA